uniref:Putative secreted protein n=1 Tax=Xenopsylla cheopis TaxID=163159 RepID=A0A6M2E2D3_XENCH
MNAWKKKLIVSRAVLTIWRNLQSLMWCIQTRRVLSEFLLLFEQIVFVRLHLNLFAKMVVLHMIIIVNALKDLKVLLVK